MGTGARPNLGRNADDAIGCCIVTVPTNRWIAIMHVESILVRGDGAALGPRLASVASGTALNVLVLMSLGADHAALLSAVSDCGIKCPIFLTETYGIIGQGCLIVAYSGGASAGHTASFPRPEDVSSLMVVADTSKAFAKVAGDAPLHYGGITKEAFVLTEVGALEKVPYFWVASPAGDEPIGVSTFTDDAAGATSALLGRLPAGWRPNTVGLLPCFTRGVNLYGEEDVESSAVAGAGLPASTRVYGMFAHGELGPSSFSGFVRGASEAMVEHKQHSMTSILAIHTEPGSGTAPAKEEV